VRACSQLCWGASLKLQMSTGDLNVIGNTRIMTSELSISIAARRDSRVCLNQNSRDHKHHNRNRALIRHGFVPSPYPLLGDNTRKITGRQTRAPLRKYLPSRCQLLYGLFNALLRRPRNDRIVFKPCPFKCIRTEDRTRKRSLLVSPTASPALPKITRPLMPHFAR